MCAVCRRGGGRRVLLPVFFPSPLSFPSHPFPLPSLSLSSSSQVVRGGPKEPSSDAVASVFDAARRGAGGLQAAPPPAPAGGGAFSGAARTLAGEGAPAAAPGATVPAPTGPAIVTIDFYTDGIFTVSGGPPRNAADPAERPFLAALAAGECPAELEEAAAAAAAEAGDGPPAPVPVSLVRHAGPYEPPAAPARATFQGTGRTLGGAGGAAAGAEEPTPAAAPAPPPPAAAGGWPGADEALPTTSLQIRLADGSRLVARFNLSQTVADIRSFIASAAPPGAGPPAYTLSKAGVPPTPLGDEGVTIEGAGLAGSVVVQRAA